MDAYTVLIQKQRDTWLRYVDLLECVVATRPDDVMPALHEIEARVNGDKVYAAGFLAYEASPGMDPAMVTHEPGDVPLLWFGLFKQVETLPALPGASGSYELGSWRPSISESQYIASLQQVHRYIKAGDTYQVNLSFRLCTEFSGEPYVLFAALQRAQQGRNAAYIETPEIAVCSASPELFLAVDGNRLKSCPMKGTAPRGLTAEADRRQSEELRNSPKNRAENVMIVDMIRNDLGRVSESGSVEVSEAFSIERYPTVLQMTSTVRSRSSASLAGILQAMFPCSSITGAPKVRTMQIIRELEPDPRGLYTGSIGCMAPGRKALFNVAIRTVVIDKQRGKAEYGTGGGVVWDSDATSEYAECLDKAAILVTNQPEFCLLETMLWNRSQGYLLLDRHLHRLARSAEYFDSDLDLEAVRKKLTDAAQAWGGDGDMRVRLLVDRRGDAEIDARPQAGDAGDRPLRVALAAHAVDSNNRFLYHKTTHRTVYEQARKERPDVDDVILYNERGEVTESTIANVVLELDGRRVTPPVTSGLLPGTYRAELLANGEIEEATLKVEDLAAADRVYLINSVRKWIPATLDK